LSLTLGGFIVPPVVVRDSGGYKVVAGHGQYAAVLARQLNLKAGDTIPVIVLEAENQATVFAQLKILKFAA
jgi:ParB-like chromosome segregation protein Spo0J